MKKASDPILPDVNVLVALGWTKSSQHSIAAARMARHDGLWFTCATTQLGFIRVASNAAVTKGTVSPVLALKGLVRILEDPWHRYVSDTGLAAMPSMPELMQRIMGHRQVTDAYLLSLAAMHGARFVTFDAKLSQLAKDICDVEILRA